MVLGFYLSEETVDFTFNEVKRDDTLKELAQLSRGPWGGRCVDQAFRDMLEEVCGHEILDNFAKTYDEYYTDLFSNFKTKKQTFSDISNSKVTMSFPGCLCRFFEDATGVTLKEAITQSRYKDKVVLLSGNNKMRIASDLFMTFFKNTVDKIIQHMTDLLESPKVQGTQTILMIGEFSESNVLQNAVQKAFPQCVVIIPEEAKCAAIRGAVIYGHTYKIVDDDYETPI